MWDPFRLLQEQSDLGLYCLLRYQHSTKQTTFVVIGTKRVLISECNLLNASVCDQVRLKPTCSATETPWGDPEGGQGVQTPLKNHKNIGILSNKGPDPLKITKLPSQI